MRTSSKRRERSPASRPWVAIAALPFLSLVPQQAEAQSVVREQVRNTVAAAEAQLKEAERIRSRADASRTAALVIQNVGDTVSGLSDAASVPFKVAANIANWTVAKQQELGVLLAARAVDRFNDVPTEQLTPEMIRAVVSNNPDLAPLTNSVGIEKIRESLLLHRSDQAAFQRDVEKAQANHDKLLQRAVADLDAILAGQSVSEDHLRDQDAAIALLTVTVSRNSEQLADTTGKILASQDRLIALQEVQQAETASGIASILRQGASVEAAVNRNYALSRLQMGLLQDNKALLEGLDVRTRSIEGGVNFLQAQQFQGMAPDAQLLILRDPSHPAYKAMFAEMPPAKRDKAVALYVEQAESNALKQQVVGTVSTTMDVLNGIQTLGNTLGWEFTQRKDFQNGMKVLNVAAGLGMAYLTGNPAMALGSLNAAFASPSNAPSAGEAQILAQLGLMDKKLDDLLEGQTKILTAIETSRKEAADMHARAMYRFDLVDRQFSDLKQSSSAILRAIVGLSPFNGQRAKCDFIRKNFPEDGSITALQSNVAATPTHFNECNQLVESVWTLPDSANSTPHFFLQMASDTHTDTSGVLKSSLETYNNQQFSPLLKLLWSAHGISWSPAGDPSSPVAWELIASLADPAGNPDTLRGKGLRYSARAGDMLRWSDARGARRAMGSQFAGLLHPAHVIEAVNDFEAMVPYTDVRDLRQLSFAVYGAADLGLPSPALSVNSRILEDQFNTVLATLNVAIAQQALLSGDYLIPNIADLVFSDLVSDLRNELVVALSKNPVLARNVLLYWLDGQLFKNRMLPERIGVDGNIWPQSRKVEGAIENWAYNLEYYDRLLAGGTVSASPPCTAANIAWNCLLTSVHVVSPGKISIGTTRRGRDGKVETLETHQIALPSSHDLESRQMIVQDDLVRLVTARREIYRLGEKMNIRKTLPPLEQIWVLPKDALQP